MKKLISGLTLLALGVGLLAVALSHSQTPESQWVQIYPFGQSAKDLPVYEASLPRLEQVEHVIAVHPADSGVHIYLGEHDLQIQPWIPGLEPHIQGAAAVIAAQGPQGDELVVPAALSSLVGANQEAHYIQWVSENAGEGAERDVEIVASYDAEQLPQRWPGEVAYAHPDLVRELTMAYVARAGSLDQLPGDFEWPSVYVQIDDVTHQASVISSLRDLGYDAQKFDLQLANASGVVPAGLLPWAGGASVLVGIVLIIVWYRPPALKVTRPAAL